MNVYDSHRMADTLAPDGLRRDRDAGRRRPDHPQHLPHPREGGRQGLFRARPHARAEGGRRGRAAASVTIAVAGCVAQAEGEEIMRRAPAVDLVVGPQSYHRLPEMLDARRGAARSSTPSSRSKTSSTISRRLRRAAIAQARRVGFRHRAGGLRQVLHLLRRALHARRRGVAAGREDRRRGRAAWPRPACARSR